MKIKCAKYETCKSKEYCNGQGNICVPLAKYGMRKCLDFEQKDTKA